MYLATLNQDQKEAFFCLAYNVVVSDGELAPAERQMMESMRREMDLSPGFEAHYLPIDGMAEVFDTRRSRAITLLSLVRLSYADGTFEIEERCFLGDLRKAFGFGDHEFEQIQQWVRRLVALENDAEALLE
ncbi:MAG: hypothetical protein U5O39_09200 [Gammaproteobacteria bacterium]|nr:hypothetical protein [Gammaproteobacteria bacterium]